jgi:hypothetical protein
VPFKYRKSQGIITGLPLSGKGRNPTCANA